MEIVLMNDDAIIPTRASKRSAGLDLYSNIDDCNGTRTHNHLIRKRTLNHLAKLV